MSPGRTPAARWADREWCLGGEFECEPENKPCRCGVCGAHYKTAKAKADHLLREHGAMVKRHTDEWGVRYYRWWRRRP